MNLGIRTSLAYDIHVIAASPAASLAIQSIANILGIEPRMAEDRLSSLPTVIAERVSASAARRLTALLSSFGMRIRLDPSFSSEETGGPTGRRRDMAIQMVSKGGRTFLADKLAQLAGLSEAEVLKGLAGPEGLVLRDLADQEITRLQRSLRRKAALRTVLTDPQVALYDAFATNVPVPVAELSRLGLGRCAFSGAVATGMNRATAAHLARRVQGGLLMVNRDFIRFDLYLAGASGVGSSDLAGFLESRGRPVRGPNGLHRIDSDLPHASAEQFIADYAAIGLEVVARLRGYEH